MMCGNGESTKTITHTVTLKTSTSQLFSQSLSQVTVHFLFGFSLADCLAYVFVWVLFLFFAMPLTEIKRFWATLILFKINPYLSSQAHLTQYIFINVCQEEPGNLQVDESWNPVILWWFTEYQRILKGRENQRFVCIQSSFLWTECSYTILGVRTFKSGFVTFCWLRTFSQQSLYPAEEFNLSK